MNDICKYVSKSTGKPYGILATAPSMDGYVSSVSALYEFGKKSPYRLLYRRISCSKPKFYETLRKI